MTTIVHPSVEERKAQGKAARQQAAPADHAGWTPAPDRPDPVALLEAQNTTREPDLVPVRHGRMMVSPFTFYRGAAKIMADDLKDTPTAGLERPAVWRRASLELRRVRIAGTNPGVRPERLRRDAARPVRVRRQAHGRELHDRGAQQRLQQDRRPRRDAFVGDGVSRGHDRVLRDVDDGHLVRALVGAGPDERDQHRGALDRRAPARRRRRRPSRRVPRRSPRRRTRATACRPCRSSPSSSTVSTGSSASRRSSSRLADAAASIGIPADQIEHTIHEQFRAYRATLQDDRRHLLERFEVVDAARKVVGVGSVGTRAFIVLLQGRDQQDPLFLQVKEATASVLEDHLPKSRYRQAGERVVQGQRMMQAASDIFLGWTKGVQDNRYLYWRQLRDMKGSAVIETMVPDALDVLRPHLRPNAGAGPRPIGRPDRHRRVPRQEGPLRPVDHRLLRAVRGSKRSGLPGVHRGDPVRPIGSTRRSLIIHPISVTTRRTMLRHDRGPKVSGSRRRSSCGSA